ncbi:tetratricopeptide repeat protein [Xanthomonas translucens]|nr:tetratricopeptide repeat protein [Xanthomonas translucens]KTF41545.1 UDP-N-acetylglucosamine--peptide N-acetylglucosaminyltransferase SEC [Xanthomonas translucens pv. translucens]KWV16902.1 UDP-N-acetylglucosamine-peptide N-acetylglucosaminyltransferase [Xanthomonas translucens]MCS3373032.1 tetratricopeptide repeat protein [Xanthomonas translucens pv. translucens]MCT8273542.1 tetratricopeptide repeat protein [Xanthomonas translucens pv. translucens]MCT8277687.1 tetratricopeptide repeat prot
MEIDHDRQSLARSRALVDAAMRDPECWPAHLAQAEALLMAASASAPDDTAALTCLGAVLCDLAKYRQAAEALQRAVRLRSDDRNTYFNLGIALLNSGKRRQAMQRFRQAASRRASAATWEAYFDPHAQ